MVDVPNNSFIPKRGPVKKARRARSRQVYVFTFVSYILIFASLVASLGVFIYRQVVDRQLDAEIAALNAEIASFSQADMERVTAFNTRLQQAKERLNATVSVASLLNIIEQSTISTAQFASFSLEREQDARLVVTAQIETDSFDSVIFQREVMKQNPSIANIEVTDLVIKDSTLQELLKPGSSQIFSPQSQVNFSTILTVDLGTVGYNPVPPEVFELGIITDTPLPAEADDALIDDVSTDGIEVESGPDVNSESI